jgi:NTE family protein
MNVQVQPRTAPAERYIPFESIALVLQGGGALGAYQAGVYEALAEAGIHPDWIASVSIGAINAAIIAGNPPNSRVDRLREFWRQITADRLWSTMGDACIGFPRGDDARRLLNHMSSGIAVASGARGFFTPHPIAPWFQLGAIVALRLLRSDQNVGRRLYPTFESLQARKFK